MTSCRWLTGSVAIGVAVMTAGCGGGATPPGSGGNQAPGAAAAVGVDAGMGDISNVPPASGSSAGGAESAGAEEMPAPEVATSADSPAAADPGALADAGATGAAMPANSDAGAPAEGANPGDSVAPPTGGNPGDGTNPAQEQVSQRGSPQYPVVMFFNMAKSGNYSQSEEVISSKAKGTAASVRLGDISDEQAAQYQTMFTDPKFVAEKRTPAGTQYTFSTAPGETAVFTIAKEGTNFVIKDLVLSSDKAR